MKWQCGGQEGKTAVIWKTLDPVWNETCELRGKLDDFTSGPRRGLKLKVCLRHSSSAPHDTLLTWHSSHPPLPPRVMTWQVYDKDIIGSDDFLGEVSVDLREVKDSGHHEYLEELSTQGAIKFTVTWLAMGETSWTKIDSAEDKSGATVTLSFINRSEQEAYVYWLRKADKPGKLPAAFRPSNRFSVRPSVRASTARGSTALGSVRASSTGVRGAEEEELVATVPAQSR